MVLQSMYLILRSDRGAAIYVFDPEYLFCYMYHLYTFICI